MKTYLLVRVHAGEATAVAGLATLGSDSLDFFLGAGEGVSAVLQSWMLESNSLPVGEVAGVVVSVVRHIDWDVCD
jgi:hypothetical protein